MTAGTPQPSQTSGWPHYIYTSICPQLTSSREITPILWRAVEDHAQRETKHHDNVLQHCSRVIPGMGSIMFVCCINCWVVEVFLKEKSLLNIVSDWECLFASFTMPLIVSLVELQQKFWRENHQTVLNHHW